jgi:hypothetical protein
MSRVQRQKSQHRQAVQHFVDNPLRLTEKQASGLLWDLCVELGYCLPPEQNAQIQREPPTNPRDFAELVMKLEGVGTGDSDMYDEVLERALSAFQKASANAA